VCGGAAAAAAALQCKETLNAILNTHPSSTRK
jgi:hypothetical protein